MHMVESRRADHAQSAKADLHVTPSDRYNRTSISLTNITL